MRRADQAVLKTPARLREYAKPNDEAALADQPHPTGQHAAQALAEVCPKQPCPASGKPMIFYPLSVLLPCGISESRLIARAHG